MQNQIMLCNTGNIIHSMLFCRYIIAAISPAIVVPSALSLKEDGYGTNSGAYTCRDVLTVVYQLVYKIIWNGVFICMVSRSFVRA